VKIDLAVESGIEPTTRLRQVSSMFDAPTGEKSRLEWKLDLPIETFDWNIGLVVGPSGSGKSTVSRHVWGEMPALEWGRQSVIDAVAPGRSIDEITGAFSSVGFNTIPAWMRPYDVLSTGEKFRVDIARRLLELPDPIIVDEFTSVVDRQVAQVGSHAIQKYVRKQGRKFIAVGCHYDVIEWLQPDWVLDMATRQFTRRSLQRRPAIECVIGRLPYAAWGVFAPYHYMNADMHRAARCFGLWANGRLAAFAGVLHRMHPTVHDIMAVSRLVTLPDWQGLGLAFVLADELGAAFAGVKKRLRTYPAHPSLVRAFERSAKWKQTKEAGTFSSKNTGVGRFGGRPCGTFEFCGETMPPRDAQRLLAVA
jgi:ABC-type lipoprotein export system ATPase subunit